MLIRYGATAVLVALFATGCSNGGAAPAPGEFPEASMVRVVVDPVTGCEYLALQYGGRPGGITPRLAPDGRQVCRLRVPR